MHNWNVYANNGRILYLWSTNKKPSEKILNNVDTKIKNTNSDLQPKININEIKKAIEKLINNKLSEKEGITTEILKNGRDVTKIGYILWIKYIILLNQ